MPLLALDGTRSRLPIAQRMKAFGLPESSRGGRAGFPLLRSSLWSPLCFDSFWERALPRIVAGAGHGAVAVAEIPVESLQVMDRPTRLGASGSVKGAWASFPGSAPETLQRPSLWAFGGGRRP